MITALVIPIYNRPKYVRQCFESLSKLTTKPDIVVLVDDCSTDMNIPVLCREYKGATVIRHTKNTGVRGALQTGIEEAIRQGAEILINLDSDAVVSPDFIARLLELKKESPKLMVSGFNAVTERNPIINKGNKWCTKKHCNGINICFDAWQYKLYIKPSLKKEGNWDYNTSLAVETDRLPFVFTVPSCVQHIGMESSMGHGKPDIAQDFKPLHLPNVTLFGIDAHNPQGMNRAAEISQRNVRFGAVEIITQRMFPGKTSQEGRANYSRFIIKELHKYIKTSHVLIIHSDGYILNCNAWQDDWLQYDYVGATWGYKDNMNVGNGGFSLRSKRLHDILATDRHITDLHPEDDKICRQYRPYLEETYDIKFAPEEVANAFSIEAYGACAFSGGNNYTGQFGFHGIHVNFTGSEKYGVAKEILYKR